MKKNLSLLFFGVALFFIFSSNIFANKKGREKYNLAIYQLEKKDYTNALNTLEELLILPEIYEDRRWSNSDIYLFGLYNFASAYHEIIVEEEEKKEKNLDLIEINLKKTIQIYQNILNNKNIQKKKYQKLLQDTQNNIEFSKNKLSLLRQKKQQDLDNQNLQKEILGLIKELKEEEKAILEKLKNLDLAENNFEIQKEKDKIFMEQIQIQRKFSILEQKILKLQSTP